jgi:DNA repair exonuclease SbcCD ATPase subunit
MEDFEVLTRSEADRVREELAVAQQTITELRAKLEAHHEPELCCSVCGTHVLPHRGCILR